MLENFEKHTTGFNSYKCFVVFSVGSTFVRWYLKCAVNKKRKMPNKVSKYSQILKKLRYWTDKFPFGKKRWTETKTSWKRFKDNTAHLSSTKTSVNEQRKLSPKNDKIFLFHSSEVIIRALFVFLQDSSVYESFWCCPFIRCKIFVVL